MAAGSNLRGHDSRSEDAADDAPPPMGSVVLQIYSDHEDTSPSPAKAWRAPPGDAGRPRLPPSPCRRERAVTAAGRVPGLARTEAAPPAVASTAAPPFTPVGGGGAGTPTARFGGAGVGVRRGSTAVSSDGGTGEGDAAGGAKEQAPAPRSLWLQDEEEFDIEVSKDGTALGVDVQTIGALLICGIRSDGAVQAWNLAHPETPVQPGDRIIEVNGQRGEPDVLVAALQRDQRLSIRLRRLNKFCVTLENFPGRLGLEIKGQDSSVKVLEINEGPVREWNQEARSDLQVRPGDRIVAVNGKKGPFQHLVNAIKSASYGGSLELTLLRGTPAGRASSTRMQFAQGALQEYQEHPRRETRRLSRARKESPPPTSPVRSRSGHIILQVW